MRLKGQVAVITGASRGVGKRIALQLAEEGATTVLAARTVNAGQGAYPGSIEETAQEVRRRGGEALAVECDLTIPGDTENLCRTALEKFGRVDFLINNAFYNNDQHYNMFLDIDLDTWEKCWIGNVLSPIIACKMLLPQMIERGKGIVISLTSPVGYSDSSAPGLPGQGGVAATYGTTKAALHRFAHNLSKETRLHNVASVILDPGFSVTERMQVQTAARGGISMQGGHSPDVPGIAVRYICTCPDPLIFNGKMIYSPDFVLEHFLAADLGKPGESISPERIFLHR
jgi:NAD(P)-dependent dehydrogenase (short-subunit alcohol dehydrogenase family)